MTWREFRRFLFGKARRRGAVLVEFAISATIMLAVLISTVEFGIEIFVRQSTEHGVAVAARHYEGLHSISDANSAVAADLPGFMSICIQPLQISLYNSFSDMEGHPDGRKALGTSADNGAAMARLTLTCKWDRMTPIVRWMLGPTMTDTAVAVVRIR